MPYPFDGTLMLKRQKSIKRTLLQRDITYIPKRIAILGGSTTSFITSMLELFLLEEGIKPEFWESEYNKYYEDAVFGNPELDAFRPEIVIVFTTSANIINSPSLSDSTQEVSAKLDSEYSRYRTIWDSLSSRFGAIIIQNNFELPFTQPEGSIVLPQSMGRFISSLNEKLAEYADSHKGFYVHDLNRTAAQLGLSRWHNRNEYYAYKFGMDYELMPDVAWSLKRLICAVLGKVKKCLVLDLDNTLWGGVIGDDGVNGLTLGRETPEGEAFTEFQEYVKSLKNRGIILAVCSKNDDDVARSGFTHPDSVLSVDDFVAFYANWDAKDVNIRRIAQEINIGLDSLVFIDDNPAERAIVRENVPEVSVPEVDPSDVSSYIRVIEGNGYFDTAAISEDDLKRTTTYQQNKQRVILEASSGSYEDFLESLDMEAEIAPFRDIYFDRIAQLTNKSNQFNLTTKRYTLADIKAISQDYSYITMYCRLKDRFGDNGVISLLIGEIRGEELHVILWLMSCRVLKRGVEDMMLDCLVKEAVKAGCTKIVGYYYPTAKNSMVKEHYKNFGFALVSEDDKGNTVWELLTKDYKPAKIFIRRTQE